MGPIINPSTIPIMNPIVIFPIRDIFLRSLTCTTPLISFVILQIASVSLTNMDILSQLTCYLNLIINNS